MNIFLATLAIAFASAHAAQAWFVVDTAQTNCYNNSGGVTASANVTQTVNDAQNKQSLDHAEQKAAQLEDLP